MSTSLRCGILLICATFCCFKCAWAQSNNINKLTVSILVFSVEQRNAFERVAAEFIKQHPGTAIDYIAADDPTYKAKSVMWLSSPGDIDVMNWPWPSRLRELSVRGLVEPVSDLWGMPYMQGYSGAMKESVTVSNNQFAIPYASGFWGFYYNKPLFDGHNLDVPNTTEELLETCLVLRKFDVVPFALGVKTPWPLLAWFDYLNLRNNGLDFYLSLARGEVPFTDPKVVNVLEEWKRLIDNQCFFSDAAEYEFHQTYPMIFRKHAAMLLSGNFFTSQIPDSVRDDIGFFPFPATEGSLDNIAHYELAPTDMFIIPKGSDNKPLAKAFLAFIAKPYAQRLLNDATSFIPTHPDASVPDDYFVDQGRINIYSAAGVGQYFDRDASLQLAQTTQLVLRDFLESGDVVEVTSRLEMARQSLSLPDATTVEN